MLQTKKISNYDYGYSKSKQINKKNKPGFKVMFTYILVLIIFALVFVFNITQTLSITHLNFQLSELEQNLKELERENHYLNLQVARESSLSKIEKIARQEFKMVEPVEMEFIVLENSSKEDINYEESKERFFLAKLIDNLLKQIDTVQAEEFN